MYIYTYIYIYITCIGYHLKGPVDKGVYGCIPVKSYRNELGIAYIAIALFSARRF